MHVWRVKRVALAAASLALIAGTPAVLAAAGVSNPWVLAGGTAVAAAVVMAASMAQDPFPLRNEHHEGQNLRVRDGCLVRADERLPTVREIFDPTLLGTHGAAPAGAGSPAYVPRDRDGEVRERLAEGGFVLLVGDSTAGKTRMAFEALRATLPGHTLIAPVDIEAIPAAISKAVNEPTCVLWLDGLERFLGPGGISAALIGRLLGGNGHHRVIAATLRAAEQARLTADVRDDDRTQQGLRDVSEVLDQAWQIRIDRVFMMSELERAAARNWDPRIAEATRHADSYGLAEYLAGAPSLLRDWEEARGSSTGTHARGAAIVTAAIDLRRAGYVSPIPRDLLDEVHETYLDSSQHAPTPREPLAAAWAWATSQRSAGTRLLSPVGDNSVEVPDYLTDSVQLRAGPLDRVPEPVLRSALASARASDASSLARTAYNQGRWRLAADAWRIACQLLETDPGLGPEHSDTLTSRGNLALVLHDLGRLDEAEAEIRTVLAITLGVVGPDHPDTVACRGNLALVLRDLGRPEEAEAEIRAVLAARQQMLGPGHPGTLASRAYLALVLRDLGRPEEAETEIRTVLAAWQQMLGPDHPSTLASRNSLALVLRSLGRLEEAEAESRTVLASWQRMAGPDHPGTLGSRNNLAGVLRDMGRLDEAASEIRTVLAGRQLLLGPDHPDTLASRSNLAGVLRALGWLDEAEAEVRAVLAIRQRVLGPDHPTTLVSRNNLARVLQERGRLEEAEAESRTVLAIRQRVLGSHHPATLASRNNLEQVLGPAYHRTPADDVPAAVSNASPSEADGAEIRRLPRAEGTPVKAVARLTGVSRSAVRSVLAGQGPRNERPAKGSIVDAVEPRIRELLQLYPDMPATAIAERIGWDRGLTVLRNRVRELRPAYLPPDPARQARYDLEQDRPA